MRSRAVLLVVAILLIAGFAALNWSEIVRPVTTSFGLFVTDAPLAAILLGLLALAVVVFALSGAAMRTQSLLETRDYHRNLEAQRELADKAEASRFTDLRQHIEAHMRELRERDAIAATELQKSVVQNQRELRTALEQINRTLAARMNELESRIDNRLAGSGRFGGPPPMVAPAEPVARQEFGQSTQMREAELREAQMREQRARQEQARAEAEQRAVRQEDREVRREERAAASDADRPANSGWRRWF